MPNYVEHSENGYIYKSKDLNGLIQAFGQAINTENPIQLQQKCNTYNNEHTIKKSTQKFIQIYKQVINNEQPQ